MRKSLGGTSADKRGSGPHRLSGYALLDVAIKCSVDYEDIQVGAGSLNFCQQSLMSLDVLRPKPHPPACLTRESVEVSAGVCGLPRAAA
jgi:hypothetical protein